MMARAIGVSVLCAALVLGAAAMAEEDPFAGGVDALAVKASAGSGSLRAKTKIERLTADMALVQVKAVDDTDFPNCVVTATVLQAPTEGAHFKLIGRGKTYRFAPVYKLKRKEIDLKDKVTRGNLGACFYPPRSKLALKILGPDMKRKVFQVAEVNLR